MFCIDVCCFCGICESCSNVFNSCLFVYFSHICSFSLHLPFCAASLFAGSNWPVAFVFQSKHVRVGSESTCVKMYYSNVASGVWFEFLTCHLNLVGMVELAMVTFTIHKRNCQGIACIKTSKRIIKDHVTVHFVNCEQHVIMHMYHHHQTMYDAQHQDLHSHFVRWKF